MKFRRLESACPSKNYSTDRIKGQQRKFAFQPSGYTENPSYPEGRAAFVNLRPAPLTAPTPAPKNCSVVVPVDLFWLTALLWFYCGIGNCIMKARSATLALGGGGARGVAHLGAIEELLAADLAVERIVGVSSGSLVGAMFAFEPDIALVARRTLDFLKSSKFACQQQHLLGAHPVPATTMTGGVLNRYHRLADLVRANRMFYRAVRQSSLLPGRLLEEVVNHLLPDADIADARVPLSIVAVDLDDGRPVVFEKGSVRLAAQASAAVPGIFPPVSVEGRLLCDIGGFCALPLWVARSYAPQLLIAVDVGANLKPLSRQPTALDVMMRMNDIGSAMFREQLRSEADLTIVPDVDAVPWFDFTTADVVIEAGRVAARAALATLPPPQSWLQRLIGETLPPLVRMSEQIRQLPRSAAGL